VPELEPFQSALGLSAPWRVVGSDFDLKADQLDLQIDFPRGARFACPACGNPCPVYDTEDKSWRHLNFFQYRTLIHARLPRVECESDGIRQVEAPWARPGSGFTVLFDPGLGAGAGDADPRQQPALGRARQPDLAHRPLPR